MLRTGEGVQGRSHQLFIQYQMVSPEDICASHIKQTEKVVFMYLGIYMWQQLIKEETMKMQGEV